MIEESVRIPASVVDLDSFCSWASSDAFPEHGRFTYLHGDIWIDMSPEEIYSHNQLKTEYTVQLATLASQGQLGKFFSDGCLLANREADVSNEPDGMFASWQTLKSGRLRRVRRRRGIMRLEGTPDMVLEVVSFSSVQKDTVELRQAYWDAGIPEYWLVDSRLDHVRFDLLRHGRMGYVAVRKQGGWLKSEVFGKSFKLVVARDPLGDLKYTLRAR